MRLLKNRIAYHRSAFKTYWGFDFGFIQKVEPRLPTIQRLQKPKLFADLLRKPQAVHIFFSGGLGLAGGILPYWDQRFSGKVLWMATSESEKIGVQAQIQPARVVVVPLPLENDRLALAAENRGSPVWTTRRRAFFNKHGLDPALPTFFFCGRITPSKGLEDFVQLADRQKVKIQLVLAGTYEKVDRVPGEFKALLKSFRSSKYCHCINLGWVPRRQDYPLMTYFDVCLSLSTDGSEDFGLFPRQALAVGTPVLITDWGGYRDIRQPRASSSFLTKLPVQQDSKKTHRPQFGNFQLAKYLQRVSQIDASEQIKFGRAWRWQHQKAFEKGVAQLYKAYRSMKNTKTKPPVTKFTTLASEIFLRYCQETDLNPTLHMPKKLQFDIMTGRHLS